jgi:hypothetical protein
MTYRICRSMKINRNQSLRFKSNNSKLLNFVTKLPEIQENERLDETSELSDSVSPMYGNITETEESNY